MPEIIALGEVLIDLTQIGTSPEGIRRYAANPGGAPANVAVAAARLGASTGFIGKVGTDTFGRDLRQVLLDNGVDVSGLCETAEATTLAVVSVSPVGERSFTFYRSPGADTLLTEEEALEALSGYDVFPRFLHFGSLSLTAEPARAATLAAAGFAKGRGSLISYDPNYRESLWPDEDTAVRWMREPIPLADVLKLSDEELPLIIGTGDLEAGTKALAEQGPRLILVTLGGEGVFYRLGTATGRVPGRSVKLADTNGAGDTFLGAVLSRLARDATLEALTEETLREVLQFANAAAALTCSRSGAIPAMPTLAEVEAL